MSEADNTLTNNDEGLAVSFSARHGDTGFFFFLIKSWGLRGLAPSCLLLGSFPFFRKSRTVLYVFNYVFYGFGAGISAMHPRPDVRFAKVKNFFVGIMLAIEMKLFATDRRKKIFFVFVIPSNQFSADVALLNNNILLLFLILIGYVVDAVFATISISDHVHRVYRNDLSTTR